MRFDQTLAPHPPTILGRQLTAASLVLTSQFAPGTTRLQIEPMWGPNDLKVPRLFVLLPSPPSDASSRRGLP